MIYCVIPRELADDLYDKMVEYYQDNPHVTVIVDRREGEDRRKGREYGGKREIRDRRRARATGTFPSTDPPEDRSEEHTSELQSLTNLVCRLLLEKKN